MATRIPLLFCFVALLVWACDSPDDIPSTPPTMLEAIDSVEIRTDIMTLSADSMEGRLAGSEGERRAVEYIASRMEEIGLEPGGDDGSYFQTVPLLGSTPRPASPLTFTRDDGETAEFSYRDDFAMATDLETDHTSTTGDLVFVGYGVDAPGYDWDDYKDTDVSGDILVMFVNDPPATEEEPDLFQGDTLTYFGRWTYKYEEARRRGARGAILIHTDETAGYPFSVIQTSFTGEQIQLTDPPENPLEMKTWISQSTAEQLAEMAGSSLDEWFEMAESRDFEPQELPVTASVEVDYETRRLEGQNVIGVLRGSERPDEAIVYTAHHDHLGMDDEGNIHNGAIDNATGVSQMLAVAEAFASAPAPPERSVLFVSVTAEEFGLLGAEYYVRNPTIPMAQTIANINLDSGNVWGRTNDIVGLGSERSELGRLLERAAASEGMYVSPDPQPGQGLFFRSDQLAFARQGVPGVFVNTGSDFIGQPEDYAQQMEDEYRANVYHQPADEFDPEWQMGGLIQQAQVAARLGYALAYSTLDPQWNEGEAFAQAREESRAMPAEQ